MPRSDLYPPVEPFDRGMLAVDDLHTLYYEQSGAEDGIPAVFLHGGPGAGATANHRRFFDPAAYRIVVFDQRGSGRSTPAAEVRDNTTAHLVADIEALRTHLGIDRWMAFGGSWGSTLALAYAQSHPDHVSALVLRGIFLGTEDEIAWFMTGMRRFFPEAWRRFVSHIPEGERDDLLTAYHRRLIDPDADVHLPAARTWSAYEAACSTLMPNAAAGGGFADDPASLSISRVEAHYFVNGVFLENDALMKGLDAIRHIPAAIVQGRYDVICPVETADRLAQAWPEARYVVVPDAGHAAMEPGVRAALVDATERFKSRGSFR